jgi:hypothetical protein
VPNFQCPWKGCVAKIEEALRLYDSISLSFQLLSVNKLDPGEHFCEQPQLLVRRVRKGWRLAKNPTCTVFGAIKFTSQSRTTRAKRSIFAKLQRPDNVLELYPLTGEI